MVVRVYSSLLVLNVRNREFITRLRGQRLKLVKPRKQHEYFGLAIKEVRDSSVADQRSSFMIARVKFWSYPPVFKVTGWSITRILIQINISSYCTVDNLSNPRIVVSDLTSNHNDMSSDKLRSLGGAFRESCLNWHNILIDWYLKHMISVNNIDNVTIRSHELLNHTLQSASTVGHSLIKTQDPGPRSRDTAMTLNGPEAWMMEL